MRLFVVLFFRYFVNPCQIEFATGFQGILSKYVKFYQRELRLCRPNDKSNFIIFNVFCGVAIPIAHTNQRLMYKTNNCLPLTKATVDLEIDAQNRRQYFMQNMSQAKTDMLAMLLDGSDLVFYWFLEDDFLINTVIAIALILCQYDLWAILDIQAENSVWVFP